MELNNKKLPSETIPTDTSIDSQTDCISDFEANKILNVFNSPELDYPVDKSIVDIFLHNVNTKPDAIAVVFNEQQLTYAQLDVLSNQLADYLISKHSIIVGDLVGLLLEKSEKVIVCIMGVLKAGGAYVPVDPEYPQQRISYIQNDSKCKVTIDSNLYDDFFTSKELFSVKQPQNVSLKPTDLSYIIYTSGTTGNPKGVMIEHRGVVNLIINHQKYFQFTADENVLFFANYCFDASVETIFLALLTGCKLSIISTQEIRNHLLLPFLEKNKITHVDITPSYLETLGDISHLKHLKRIVVGGEVCSLKLARKMAASFDFYNSYGPTENSITSTIFKYSSNSEKSDSFSIGKPINNTGAYILSDDLELKTIGEVGELCLSGVGLSRGYLNLPELTSQKFVDNPFKENGKLYKTGDLAKWLPTGDIEYVGRKDNQVKIRGYRIELEEVESQLLTIDQIKIAVVLVEDDRLIAYILLNQNVEINSDTVDEWKKHLLTTLPVYFIPYKFKIIEKIPITSNGKLDKKALLEQDYLSITSTTALTEPRTETERLVADIWQEGLKIDEIDIFSNFFELGGHSLIAVKIINKLEQATKRKLALSSLFEYSTVEKFAKLLDGETVVLSDCVVPIKSHGHKIPLFMVHGAGLQVLYFVNLIKYLDAEQPLYGIQGVSDKGFDNWYQTIEEMAAHYIEEMIKVNPNGPYAIVGYCAGGIVAFEMAKQLKEQGRQVSMIATIDSYLDSSYNFKSHQLKNACKKYENSKRRFVVLLKMFSSLKAFKMRFAAKKQYLKDKKLNENNNLQEQNHLASEQFIKNAQMMYGLLDQYKFTPINIEIDVLRSEKNEYLLAAPKDLGWKKAAKNGVKTHHIPASDFDMRIAPHDKILAKILQNILDERHMNLKFPIVL